MLYTPSGTELMLKQTEMRDRIGDECARGAPDARNAPIVEAVFPNGRYDALVQRVVDEAHEKNTDLKRRLSRGDWLWD